VPEVFDLRLHPATGEVLARRSVCDRAESPVPAHLPLEGVELRMGCGIDRGLATERVRQVPTRGQRVQNDSMPRFIVTGDDEARVRPIFEALHRDRHDPGAGVPEGLARVGRAFAFGPNPRERLSKVVDSMTSRRPAPRDLLPVPVLTRFFAQFPGVNARTRLLLTRSLWRELFTGAHMGSNEHLKKALGCLGGGLVRRPRGRWRPTRPCWPCSKVSALETPRDPSAS
jgi:hypothetical protein